MANSSSSSDLLFITLSNEIEESLKKLNAINGKMRDSLNAETSDVSSSGSVHTLQRHSDILRDYTHEYEKTKRNIISYKEREKLLSTSSNNNNRSMNSNESNLNNRRNENGSTSLYMKEYDHLKSSHNLIDQQLEYVLVFYLIQQSTDGKFFFLFFLVLNRWKWKLFPRKKFIIIYRHL